MIPRLNPQITRFTGSIGSGTDFGRTTACAPAATGLDSFLEFCETAVCASEPGTKQHSSVTIINQPTKYLPKRAATDQRVMMNLNASVHFARTQYCQNTIRRTSAP